MQVLQFAYGVGGGALGGVKKGQISQQGQALFVAGVQLRAGQRLAGHRQHFHAVFGHFVHHGVDAGQAILLQGAHRVFVGNVGATAADRLHAAFHDQQRRAFLLHQHAGQLALIVKGQFVQLGVPGGQFLQPGAVSRHLPAMQNGASR